MTFRAKMTALLLRFGLLLCCSGISTQLSTLSSSDSRSDDDPVALFLGTRLSDNSYASVKALSLDTVQAVYEYTSDESAKSDFDEITEKAGEKNSWQYSYEPHVTNLYIGGVIPPNPDDAKLYSSFEEDIKCSVKISAVAYLPGNLIAGIAFIDLSQLLMSNSFPHTTLLNKGMSAKYSNDLIEALNVNEQFQEDYSNQFINAKPIMTYPITIKGKTYTAYVRKLDKPLLMTGYTHKFYTS